MAAFFCARCDDPIVGGVSENVCTDCLSGIDSHDYCAMCGDPVDLTGDDGICSDCQDELDSHGVFETPDDDDEWDL